VAPGNGAIWTLAGDAEEEPGFAGGQGAAGCFNDPRGMALDTDGRPIVTEQQLHPQGDDCWGA